MRHSSVYAPTVDLPMDREIDGKYEVIKIVSDKIEEVTTVANADLTQMSIDIQEILDFTDITIVGIPNGQAPLWDADTKTLYIPKGDKGDKGIAGNEGAKGNRGDTGTSVDHSKATFTTDPEGDFGEPGQTDTYTLYGDKDETIILGSFVVYNGTNELSAKEIKDMYESNPDTYVFNNTYKNDIDSLGIANGAVQKANVVSDFNKHGVVAGTMAISVNATNPNLIDISEGVYYINKDRNEFNASQFDTSSFTKSDFGVLGIDISGTLVVKKNTFFAEDELLDVLEIGAFLKTEDSVVGPINGSSFDIDNFVRNTLIRAKAFEGTYFNGTAALITQNTTPLLLDIGQGFINTPEGEVKEVNAGTRIGGIAMYRVGGVYTTVSQAPLIVNDTKWDNGTDLVDIAPGKYVVHTVARSSRTSTVYLITGTQEFDSEGDAKKAPYNLGIFAASESTSEVEPLSNIVVRQGVGIVTGGVVDLRPSSASATSKAFANLTLQAAYDLSGTPSIELIGANPLDIRNDAVDSSDISQQWTNADGSAIATVGKVGIVSEVDVTVNSNVIVTGTVDGRDISTDGSNLDSHIADTANPHNVDKIQVGLANVDNVADVDKPVSTAQQAAIDAGLVPKEDVVNKGIADGYAGLDSNGIVPASQLPNVIDISGKEDKSNKGVSDGYASLNSSIKVPDSQLPDKLSNVPDDTNAELATLTSHTVDTSNPHVVTADQIGLGNVDNTSDDNKPVSIATTTALNLKASNLKVDTHILDMDNPHGVDATDIGLANVDNTSDVSKPVSTATQTALNLKANVADVYDKTENDSLLFAKSDKVTTYTKTEVDGLLGSDGISLTASTTQVSGTNEVSNTTVENGMSTKLHTGNGSTQDVANGIDFVTASSNVTVLPLWVAGTYNTGNERTIVREGRTIRVVCLQDGVTSNPNDLYNFVDAVFSDWQIDSQTNGGLVWFKDRVNVAGGSIFHTLADTLRGANKAVYSNDQRAENTSSTEVIGFGATGVSVGSSLSYTGGSYISWSYQTTHVKSSLTSHGKPQIEEFNPITGFTMIKYKGSGSAEHAINQSLDRELGVTHVKNTSTTADWNSHFNGLNKGYYRLNTAEGLLGSATDYYEELPNSYNIKYTTVSNNNLNDQYILYGWANATETDGNVQGNFEIGTYVGTGAAGNKVTTKDKPLYLMVKRTDSAEYWLVYDNQRDNATNPLYLNTSDAEATTGYQGVVFGSNSFTVNDVGDANADGGKYLYMVVYDNDNGSGKSKYDAPSATSNLNITDGGFVYTSGKGNRGYVLDNNTFTGSVDSVGQDGLKWIAKDRDADTFKFFDNKPSNGLYEKTSADDNRIVFLDSKQYEATGGELATNGTFDTDTAWTKDANWTIANGRATCSGGVGQSIFQNISTIADTLYVVEYTVSSRTAGSVKILGGTNDEYRTADGTYRIVTTFTGELQFYTPDGFIGSIDNVSVFKQEPTLGTEISPISFMKNPVRFENGIPQFIDYTEYFVGNYTDDLSVDSLEVKDFKMTDRPIFKGYAGGTHITTPNTIFDWTVDEDTHNAYDSGIWTCPKDGWYRFNPRVWNSHANSVQTTVDSAMYINGTIECNFFSRGTVSQRYIGIEPTILKKLKIGDTMYIKSIAASAVHSIYFESDKAYTNIVIEWIGE